MRHVLGKKEISGRCSTARKKLQHMRKSCSSIFLFCLGTLAAVLCSQATAQTIGVRQARITQALDESQREVLVGNMHPLARPEFDRGIAPTDLPMERMLLVLTRSAEQEAALEALLVAQQNPSSSQYHQWLTPQQFGEEFGAADADIQTVMSWLQFHGFQVNRVSQGKNVIDFSGTANQVAQAFHTEIHKYVVNGVEHWANASNPQIPTALAPVIAGIATLHNFGKRGQLVRSGQTFAANYQPGSRPEFNASSGLHALSPADYAVIYHLNPMYQAGITGAGATIAVVARTNIHVPDIVSFRSLFGLSNNPPQVIVNGTDPGDLGGGEEAEAVLDSSWVGATAPGGTVRLVVSKTTNSTDGVDLSELYIIDNNQGDVMTESFGDCEANFTLTEANFYAALAQQAAAEGITYLVSAGDSGAEGCDAPTETAARDGLSVNLLASNPFVVAVGGTEFNEDGNSVYWSGSNNSVLESATGYIPEGVWNESCTSARGANPCTNGNTPGLWAGGGGASALFSKPAWQSGVAGIPNDGARDVPDVSLSAAGHDPYLICLDGSCTPNGQGQISFSGFGGTSASTPSFAGIMALAVQKTGSRQGQADVTLYALAAGENFSQCNGSNPSVPAPQVLSGCIFNDVTAGNNAVPGESGYNSTSGLYQAAVGYDLATGLGSVNATALVNAFNGAAPSPEPLTFVPIQPCRVADTRDPSGPFGGPEISGASSRDFIIPNSACGIPPNAAAYSLNVTVVPQGQLGYLTIWPSGQSQPVASTLNSDGRIKANAAIVRAGANGAVTVFATDTTQVILDINGYFVPGASSALNFYPTTACRIADTRQGALPFGGPSLNAGETRSFPITLSGCNIPGAAQAYSLNITAVPHNTLDYLTAWPTGQTQPYISTLNASTGAVTANAAIVRAGTNGSISLFVTDASDVVIDINGYFGAPANGGLSFYPVNPCRALDTRFSSGQFSGTLAVNVAGGNCGAELPAAKAYVLNSTAVPPAPLTYLTLWPDSQPQPYVSTLNSLDGAITSNMSLVPTVNGSIDAFASNPTQLVLDISGYFAP